MTSSVVEVDYDSVVVGGGLIGATLAALLSQKFPNWRVALLDVNRPRPITPDSYDSKVIALSDQACGLLREIGVLQELESWSCNYSKMVVWDAEGTGRIEFSSEEMGVPNLGAIIENGRILSSVWKLLASLPNLEIICPAKVESLENDQHFSDPQQPVESNRSMLCLEGGQTITTRLVCAVDGANSTVRGLLQLPTRDWSYDQSALVATITTEKEHQQTCWQRFMPTGPLAFLPLQHPGEPSNRCSIVWSLDKTYLDSIESLTDSQLCEKLTEESESVLGRVVQVEGRAFFPLHQRHAVDYVRPGAALVGDAAHTIHPLAGQGANLGFQDVEILLRELTRGVNRGLEPGDLSVLQRYQRERKTENLLMMAAMESFKRLFGSDDLGVRWLRNKALNIANSSFELKQLFVRQASAS